MMPRLLYIGENPAAGTGSPIIILRHLRRFAAEGWSISIMGEHGGDYRECAAAGWTVHFPCRRRWWWPPFRDRFSSLRWMRLRLLAHEVVDSAPEPTVIFSYLAAHADFSADLAGHVAQITGAPLHMLVHDDVAAFPAARGKELVLRQAHENILRAADVCWYVSPELADCFPATAPNRRILFPIPEGWDRPAVWNNSFKEKPKIFYAGYVWPQQLPLLAKVATAARQGGCEPTVMTKPLKMIQDFCVQEGVRWHPPFPTNREALEYLVAHAAGLLVSYAAKIEDMPWCASSFPSKLVEYCHLGLPIAVIAPVDSAVCHWAKRVRYPYFFEPHQLVPLQEWFAGLKQRDVWQVRAALSLHIARTEFDPRKIQSELAGEMIRGTQRRAA